MGLRCGDAAKDDQGEQAGGEHERSRQPGDVTEGRRDLRADLGAGGRGQCGQLGDGAGPVGRRTRAGR